MNINSIVVALRKFRSLHRWVGIALALFFIIIATTGILLGWKKNVALLQPVTSKGKSHDLRNWIGFDEVAVNAKFALDSIGISRNEIDRFDVRPDKGIIKILFKQGYWEVQLDGTTGKVLSIAQRHSDWIEHLHDGSIFNEFFKLIYTNMMGVGLLILSASGVWLWYAPKVIRRSKAHRKN